MKWKKRENKVVKMSCCRSLCMGVTSTQWFSSGSELKITANKETNDCGISMMTLGDGGTLTQAPIVRPSLYVLCIRPEWASMGESHLWPIHTPSTSSSSPGVSRLPCTYTPPSQTRELLLSLSTYPQLEWGWLWTMSVSVPAASSSRLLWCSVSDYVG